MRLDFDAALALMDDSSPRSLTVLRAMLSGALRCEVVAGALQTEPGSYIVLPQMHFSSEVLQRLSRLTIHYHGCTFEPDDVVGRPAEVRRDARTGLVRVPLRARPGWSRDVSLRLE